MSEITFQLGAELRLAAGVKLYELRRFSSGAAAKLEGLPRTVFLTMLADLGLEDSYGVKVFSLNNWGELFTWFDALEAGMTPEHKAGLSAAHPET